MSGPRNNILVTGIVGIENAAKRNIVEYSIFGGRFTKKITALSPHTKLWCGDNPDLSLLTANLLVRDASDANPSIRCSSISALAALPGMDETSVRVLSVALSDQAPQVRRSAAASCISLFGHAPEAVLSSGLVDALYECIRDSDPIVIINCILSLDHILSDEGGIVVNKTIAHYLLGQITQFSNSNVSYILSLLLKYNPKSKDEVFLMLNSIDETLSSRMPNVLINAIKLFLHITQDFQHLKKDMLETVQPAICKILSQNIPETSYLVLDFLCTIGDIREVFSNNYKFFLVRGKDPGYLKSQKLKVLPLVCNEQNVGKLIEEVKPFCTDYQSFKDAIRCLGTLGQVNSSAKELCCSSLIPLLESPTEQVVAASLECLLIIFPTHGGTSSSSVSSSGEAVTYQISPSLSAAVTRALSSGSMQESSPALVLHVLGNLAHCLPSSPDILEQISSVILAASSPDVYSSLIKAAARVFLAQPSQTQLLLSSVLSTGFQHKGLPTEMAALVYAVLQEPPEKAALLLGCQVYSPKNYISNNLSTNIGSDHILIPLIESNKSILASSPENILLQGSV
ncbi:unnamed protein product, partial [Meganyctiphanes norvegica]